MEQTVPVSSPVVYPQITVGGQKYDLKFSHTAWIRLAQWKINAVEALSGREPMSLVAFAAAAAGHIDSATGKWRSADFRRPEDLTDAMEGKESVSDFMVPVLEALKKVAPDVTIEPASPATEEPQVN